MNPNKAFRKFGRACMDTPPGANLTVGVTWIETKGWRVMMNVHTSMLHLGSKEARGLADIYDKHHESPEWRGKTTGLEWVAPELRTLSDEVDQKNAVGAVPPEVLNDEDYDHLSGFSCDHEDFDVDILSGRASCNFCSHHWYVSDEQVLRRIEHERAYNEYLDRESRRQWWRDLFASVLNWRWRLQKWRWSRERPITDDDIPF